MLFQTKFVYYRNMLFSFLENHPEIRKFLKNARGRYLYLPAIIFFTTLFFPFFGLIPYLDGDTEFLIAVNFYLGKYLSNWMPYHPPIKLVLSSILFHFFGFFSYSFLGYLFGIFGITALFVIAEKVFDKKTAILASLLFSLSGIYISSALFSLNDFLMTVFILFSFAFYVKEKYFLAAVLSCFAVMSKESAIIFPLSIILVELCKKKWRIVNILPFLTLFFWVVFLHVTGHTLWNSWNFSNDRNDGSLLTVVNNILTGSIFNNFAYENWLHLFVFNYNWVLWIFVIWSLIKIRWNSYFFIIALFSTLYTVTILSFQTFSITRYILPIIPFMYLFVAEKISHTRYQLLLIPIVFVCVVTSLLTSSDPVSDIIWHNKWQILNQNFYINRKLDGNDGITYNMQFLYLTKARTHVIRTGNCAIDIDTLSIYPETLRILNIPQCH